MRKHLSYIFFLLMLGGVISCVDDYEDANPPLPLDAPFSTLSVEDDTLAGGESTSFTITIVDAPGGIDSVGYITTDDKGQVIIDDASLNAAMGQQEGVITGTFIAPNNARGDFTLTLVVYDMQSEPRKSYTISEELFIEAAFEDPSFTLTASENDVALGESTTLSINVEAPANIENVRIFSSNGSVILDEASLESVRGATSGTVTATYTAPEAPSQDVGPVTFTVFVEDELQEVEVSQTFDEVVEVVYAEEGPSITFNLPEQGVEAFEGTVSVNAPGVIDTIIVEAFSNRSEEEVGELTYNVEDLIGTTGGTFDVAFEGGTYIGFVELVVTVIDEQGAMRTELQRVLIEPVCLEDLEGTYNAVTSGTSTDPCPENNPLVNFPSTVQLTLAEGSTIYNVSDVSAGAYAAWYEDCYDYDAGGESGNIELDCDSFSISIIPFTEEYGTEITGSGSYNPETGVITYEWSNGYGDTGVVTLTPQ